MLDITIIQKNEKEIDVRVNSQQKIADTLAILADREIIENDTKYGYIQTMRLKEAVNIQLTYSQAGIYTGDILYLP